MSISEVGPAPRAGQFSTVRVGVIGYGYWGPNVVRNLFGLGACDVVMLADRNVAALQKARRTYPSLQVTTDPNEVLTAPGVDAVAIVTPVWTHYELARAALENGKHVFVEKPFTSTSRQAEELIELAERKNLRIMVDHTFLFTGAVKKIRDLIDTGTLGPLLYFDSSRINLGLFQHDVSVIWDLAPHDLAIMDYVIGEQPQAVVATGGTHFGKHADIAFLTIYFPNNVLAHINVNWMSPVKVRTTLIGGREKMLVWNDLEADEKIKVYDKGVTVTNPEGVYDVLVSYRSGDVWAPKVAQVEALTAELAYFLDCISSGATPFNDGVAGLRVVRMLEAADRSLAERGELIALA